jgi:hypothetical protein
MHPPILCIWFRRWPTTAFPWIVRLPTPPTWLHVIFSYSPSWKSRWKQPDFNQEKTLCGTRRPSWTPFQKKRSRSVSNSGGTTGKSVCITKWTTLKEIKVNLFYMNKCIFVNQRFDTFWTHHVYIYIFEIKAIFLVPKSRLPLGSLQTTSSKTVSNTRAAI